MLADRILTPESRSVAGDKVDINLRFNVGGAVVSPERQDLTGAVLTKHDSVSPRASVWSERELFSQKLIESRRLGREHGTQRVMRCLSDGAIHRGITWGGCY